MNSHPVQIEIVEQAPENFAIVAGCDGGLIVLQQGYKNPKQALTALAEALTTAPPDISTLEEAAGHVPALLDGMGALNEAMTLVGDRLNQVEDRLDGLELPQVAPARTSTLLRPRTAVAPARVQPPAPPPIRRPKVLIPHEPTGGVGRGPSIDQDVPVDE